MTKKISTRKFAVNAIVFLGMTALPLLAFAAILPDRLISCDGTKESPCDFKALIKLVQNIINFLVYMSAPVAAVAFAWAGVLYLTAAGDETKIGKAHTIFTDVLIGLGIVLSAWLIVKLIVTGLGVRSGLSPLR